VPTLITHPAIALGAAPWLRRVRKRGTIGCTGAALTLVPDLDVLAFKIGLPYGHMRWYLNRRSIS
jgi:hypothetical protein